MTPGAGQFPDVRIDVVRCKSQPLSPGLFCSTVPAWGTDDLAGQQIQPTIALVDKSPDASGLEPQWSYAFYSDALARQASGDEQRLAVAQITMQGGQASADQLLRRSPDRAARVCPAYYPGANYWGDYFGYVGFRRQSDDRWMHLAAYSDDETQDCTFTNIWQGHHLHVVSTDWLDP